jgi:hypothetical protein
VSYNEYKKMKTIKIACTILCAAFLSIYCSKEDSGSGNGTIQFKCVNPIAASFKSFASSNTKSGFTNPSLTGEFTETVMTSMKLTIGDVWVSKGEVKHGATDNLEWVRLTKSTNRTIKLFEDYTFDSVEIPAGDYNSIKITFRNVFYRHVRLLSNPSIAYELLETMGSWTDPCDVADTSWAKTNYFGKGGNHIVDQNGIFQLVSEGEKLGGLKILEGKKAIVSWRLGAGVINSCKNILIDVNKNLRWDCGIDRIEDVCPPEVKYMWDFVVEYQ